MALVLSAHLVPFDRLDPQKHFDGSVFIDDSGVIERVLEKGESPPSGYQGAPVLDLGKSLVLPGFIDLHNHIGYNTLMPWTEPKQKVAFVHHDSWTRAPTYQSSISWPANALIQAEPEAVLAYVQLRALVGGTTSIQGWPTANRKSVQAVRNIDDETAGGTNHNLILTSALTKKPPELARIAQAQRNGAGFIYHCAEGQAGSIVAREFIDAAFAGCLETTFVAVHCCAINKEDWKRWTSPGGLAWSPFSNLWLYGQTSDIDTARKQGVQICLGSDWGPSGTKNVQGELKVAKIVNDKQGLRLSDFELVSMITSNPGDLLSRCWKRTIGRLAPGAFADITALRADGAGSTPWTTVLKSTEKDVLLVVYAGLPRYGDAALMAKANLSPSAPLKVAGRARAFAIPDPFSPAGRNPAWSFEDITRRLEVVRQDPAAALRKAEHARRAFGGRLDAPDAPLRLALDMPSGADAYAGRLTDVAHKIVIPPLASLTHDQAFFNAVAGHGFHGGLLDPLAAFYQ